MNSECVNFNFDNSRSIQNPIDLANIIDILFLLFAQVVVARGLIFVYANSEQSGG